MSAHTPRSSSRIFACPASADARLLFVDGRMSILKQTARASNAQHPTTTSLMHVPEFLWYVVALAAGVVGDVAICLADQVPSFWSQLVPSFYCIAIVRAAINHGVKGGFGAAVLSSLCHVIVITTT